MSVEQGLLQFVLDHIEIKDVEILLEVYSSLTHSIIIFIFTCSPIFPTLIVFLPFYFLHQGLLEARQELRPLLSKSQDCLKDLLFLDISLDSTVRTAVERGYEQLDNAGPEVILILGSNCA